MTQDSLFDLEAKTSVNIKDLLDLAYSIRQSLSDSEIRDLILALLFYKHTSEKMVQYVNKEDAIKDIGFYLELDQRYTAILNSGDSIIENLKGIFLHIDKETTSKEDIGLFHNIDLDFLKLGEDKNKVLHSILMNLNKIDLSRKDKDVLGDIYEYFNGGRFGEFYTPQPVSKLVAKIVSIGKDKILSVYDPTCGSGSLLMSVAKETPTINFYGQEINRTTFNLSRMNMIMHNVHYNNFNIQLGDALENPKHLDQKFDAIVANPPYSITWSAKESFKNDPRFKEYNALAPKSKADFAFVQHMIYHLDDNGRMAVVLPHGVLFRGGVEEKIRKHLIDKNYIDAIIGLPEKLFINTAIPTCILVLKKNKSDNKILFIDASEDFIKDKKNNLLTEEHIEKILSTYKGRIEKGHYSYDVPLDKIIDNGYNLNIRRFVTPFKEEVVIDLKKTWEEIQVLNREIEEYENEISKVLKEIGLI